MARKVAPVSLQSEKKFAENTMKSVPGVTSIAIGANASQYWIIVFKIFGWKLIDVKGKMASVKLKFLFHPGRQMLTLQKKQKMFEYRMHRFK